MFNIDELRRRLEAMIREYPELAEDDDLRLDMFEGETDLFSALTTLVTATTATTTMIDALSERIDQNMQRRARFARRVERLRELMLSVLQSADLKKIELPDATLSQRANAPQIVGQIDADVLPDEFVRIKREADKVKIREALLEHREVPGLHLSNSPPSLVVSVR